MLLPAFLLLSLSGSSVAQTGGDGVPVTFEQALDIAVGGSPRLEALKWEQQSALNERRAAMGLRSPSIGLTAAYVRTQKTWEVTGGDLAGGIFDELGDMGVTIPDDIAGAATGLLDRFGFTILPREFATVGASITVPVFTGGKINAANRSARIAEENVSEKGRQIEGELMSELVERYYGLLLAEQAVQVRQQVVDAMRQHLSDALALEQNGVIARSERLYVEVKLYEAERDLTDALSQAATTRSALSNTLNSDLAFRPVSAMFILRDIPSVDRFREWALENNPQLQQVELGRQLAVQGVTLARSEFYPQVAGIAGGNLYKYNLSKRMPNWVVGAGVSFKIFDGLQKEHKLASAKNTVRSVESLQVKAEKDIALLVEKLYNELLNNAGRMPAVEKSIEFATEYLRVMNISFREGVSTSVDIIDAELNLAANRIEKLQTAYQYDLALAKLLEAAGLSGDFMRYARSGNAVQIVY